jgi:hypothetical protein
MDPSLKVKLYAFAAALFMGAMAALAFFASKEKKSETPNRGKMAGLIVGAVVTGLMGLVFAWRAYTSSSADALEVVTEQTAEVAPANTSGKEIGDAEATVGALPDPKTLAQQLLSGEKTADEISAASKNAAAQAERAAALATAGSDAAKGEEGVTTAKASNNNKRAMQAAINAQAAQAKAEEAAKTAAALTNQAKASKEAALKTHQDTANKVARAAVAAQAAKDALVRQEKLAKAAVIAGTVA